MENLLPRKVAELKKANNGNFKLITYKDIFDKAIEECGDCQIMFIPIIGHYQIGKSSFLSMLMKNEHIEIGDSVKEKTMGVDLIGPVDYNSLKESHGESIDEKQNLKIFFVDTQGYGGYTCGSAEENMINITRLISSFIPLSQVVLLLTESNISLNSSETYDTTFDLVKSYYTLFDEKNMKLINIVRLKGSLDGISYSKPNRENYKSLCEILANTQSKRIEKIRFDGCFPYPHFNIDLEKPIENLNNKDFSSGFKLLLTDLFNAIDSSSNSLHLYQERIKATYQYYSRLVEGSLKSLSENSKANADLQILKILVDAHFQPHIEKNVSEFENRLNNMKNNDNYPFLTNYKYYSDLIEPIEKEKEKFVSKYPEYTTELNNIYTNNIKSKFISKCKDHIISFEKDLKNSQISAIYEDIEKNLNHLQNKEEEKLKKFKERERSKYSFKSFHSDARKIIDGTLKTYIKAAITSAIDEVKRIAELRYQEITIDLDKLLNSVVSNNINKKSKIVSKSTKIIKIGAIVITITIFVIVIVLAFLFL